VRVCVRACVRAWVRMCIKEKLFPGRTPYKPMHDSDIENGNKKV